MGILNRTKEASEQRVVLAVSNAATATGVTLTMGIVPYPSVVDCGQIAAWGLSGAPSYAVIAQRFIAGSGVTQVTVATGTSNIPAEFGTSGAGAFGASLFGASGLVVGSSILLLANDLLTVVSGVANAAAKGLAVSVVLRPIQDTKVHFGLV